MQSLVSIIIPCFNYAHLLSDTLGNLLNQQYMYWEAIIVDDGSTDNTELIVRNFIEKDKRIKYLKQERGGVSVARNLGIKHAKGEFLQFLDADDLISPGKINLQIIHLLDNPTLDICFCRTFYFKHPDQTLLYSSFNLQEGDIAHPPDLEGSGFEVLSELLVRNLMICSPLFRRSVIEKVRGFEPGIAYAEDHDFWLRCALKNFTFSYLDNPDVYSCVRVHAESASQNKFELLEGESKLRLRIQQMILGSELTENQKETLLSMNKILLKGLYRQMIHLAGFTNTDLLRRVYLVSGIKAFIVSYFKELNKRRKYSSSKIHKSDA